MQLINEAYLILKDSEARNKFDIEYQKFKTYKKAIRKTPESNVVKHKKEQPKQKTNETEFVYYEYVVNDDVLRNWMANAKRQAVYLAKQAVIEFSDMVSVGIKEGAKSAGHGLMVQIILAIFFLYYLALIKVVKFEKFTHTPRSCYSNCLFSRNSDYILE